MSLLLRFGLGACAGVSSAFLRRAIKMWLGSLQQTIPRRGGRALFPSGSFRTNVDVARLETTPPCSRADSDNAREGSGEMTLIRKATRQGHRRERQLAIAEQRLCHI